jgi:spermidine synthase
MRRKKKKKHTRDDKAIVTKRIRITSVMLIYFCSGACSLIDEVVWVRLLKLTLGNTVYASSIVVSMFMAGLALGALIMSRYADRVVRQLRLYAILEVLVTISALLMPWSLRLADGVYHWFYIKYQPSPTGLLFVQMVVSAFLLLVPTMLMGSTLPLLGRYVTTLEQRVGHFVGRLYALNTLGAALGCFLAGFIFIRMVGVMGTLYIAAGINLFVAFGGWLLSRSHESVFRHTEKKTKAQQPDAVLEETGVSRQYVLAVGFFLSGLISIGYELIWMRSVVVPLGGFTYVFSAVLTVYLVGNVLGAWIGSRLSKRLSNPAVAFGLSLTCLGALGVFYIPWFRTWFSFLRGASSAAPLFEGSLGIESIRKASLPLFHSFFLFLLPAVAMGIGFPLALQSWGRFRHKVGQTTGTVYGVNTIGAVLGGVLTGFVLIPLMGVQLSIMVLGLAGIWLGGTMVQVFHAKPGLALRIGSLVTVVALTVAAAVIPSDTFLRSLDDKYFGKILSVREGLTTTVAVTNKDDGSLLMAIDHIEMAGDGIHRSAQKTLGHLAVLLHSDPKDVLTFGFGTGETTACLAQHDLRRIDCVEIAPEVTEVAVKFFKHINLGEQLSQKVNMIYTDGKNYLNLTDRKYDIILNDSNVHSTSGSAPLFTKEHFQSALVHLNPGGLFMTKLHLEGHPKTNFDSILATFMEVFPHVTVWFPTTKPFVFFYLVGSADKQLFSPKRIDDELGKENVRNSVEYLNFENSADVLTCYIGDKEDIRRYLKTFRINSDYTPYLEFNLDSKNLILPAYFPELIQIVRGDSVIKHIDWDRLLQTEREQWRKDFELRYQVATLLLRAHGEKTFFSKFLYGSHGLKLMPQYAPLLELREDCVADIEKALRRRLVNPDIIIADMDDQIRNYPDSGMAWLIKSMVLRQKGNMEEAFRAAEKAVQYTPNYAEVYFNLGMILARREKFSQAGKYLSRALQINPDHDEANYNLSIILAVQGKIDEPLEHYSKAVQLNPNIDISPDLHRLLAINFAKANRFHEAVSSGEKALDLANAANDKQLAENIEKMIRHYRQKALNEK